MSKPRETLGIAIGVLCWWVGAWSDGCRDGGMEGWRDGGMEGWRDGGMEGWKEGMGLLVWVVRAVAFLSDFGWLCECGCVGCMPAWKIQRVEDRLRLVFPGFGINLQESWNLGTTNISICRPG